MDKSLAETNARTRETADRLAVRSRVESVSCVQLAKEIEAALSSEREEGANQAREDIAEEHEFALKAVREEARREAIEECAEEYANNVGLHSSECYLCSECKTTILALLKKGA